LGLGLDAPGLRSQRDRGAGEARGIGDGGGATTGREAAWGGQRQWCMGDEERKGREEDGKGREGEGKGGEEDGHGRDKDGHGKVARVERKGDGGEGGRIRVVTWSG